MLPKTHFQNLHPANCNCTQSSVRECASFLAPAPVYQMIECFTACREGVVRGGRGRGRVKSPSEVGGSSSCLHSAGLIT